MRRREGAVAVSPLFADGQCAPLRDDGDTALGRVRVLPIVVVLRSSLTCCKSARTSTALW